MAKIGTEASQMKDWFVYMVECSDGTIYTGVSDDVEARVKTHNEGRGAKYTQIRTPVVLRFVERVGERGAAQKREHEIKKMKRSDKMRLW
jgi:putative endonuclease